jgi:hypothetical protein
VYVERVVRHYENWYRKAQEVTGQKMLRLVVPRTLIGDFDY